MDYSSQGQGQQGMQQGVGMPWAYGMPGMLVGQMGEGQAQMMVPMGSPEMVQGMTYMMPGPYMVSMGPMGAMAMAGGQGVNPHLAQMLAESAKGGRASNVFFKTRVCNKWRAGACPYGDKCTYAHGEHELRYVPPELVAQLERAQAAAGGAGGGGGNGNGVRGAAQHDVQAAGTLRQQQGGDDGSPGSEARSGFSPPPPAGGGASGGRYKTRLCIKFMQTGFCSKASACTFAHGYDDLRHPGGNGTMTQDGPVGYLSGGMMAPQMRAVYMQRGAPMMHVPEQQQHAQRGYGNGGGRPHSGGGAAPPAERARAMCALVGVGAAVGAASPTAMQAAMAAVRDGSAFRGGPYSDSIEPYAAAQQEAQQQQRSGSDE